MVSTQKCFAQIISSIQFTNNLSLAQNKRYGKENEDGPSIL